MGHLKATTGDVRAALAHLATAAQHARQLERSDQVQQLERAKVLYEARYLLRPKDAVQALRLAYAHLPTEDALAGVSLQLELSRQYLLRGKVEDARLAFGGAVRGLIGAGNRRYEIATHVRLMDLALATGNVAEAAFMAETAVRSLDAEGDDLLAYEIAQRRVAALARLAPPPGAARLKEVQRQAKRRLEALARRTGFAAPETPHARAKPRDPGLNYRQIALLRDLGDQEVIDVQQYKQRFVVSEITASRDLSHLARGGHLRRLGKARATRYAKLPPAEASR